MYYDEEPTEVIGANCSLLEDYKGYTEGRVVGDFGTSLVVQLATAKRLSLTGTSC